MPGTEYVPAATERLEEMIRDLILIESTRMEMDLLRVCEELPEETTEAISEFAYGIAQKYGYKEEN